jgi:DNA helicase-2/ATP-dependent DNA helicase PcrA
MVSSLFCIVPMHSLVLEDALRKEISHTVFMEVCLLSRKEIKDVLCYCLVLNPKDEEALMRVINYPARGIEYDDRKIVAANHYKEI